MTGRRWLWALFGLAAAAAVVWMVFDRAGTAVLFAAVKRLGVWGPWLLVVLYVPYIVLLLPGWVLNVGAGYVYGPGWGGALAAAGTFVGAVAAFGLGRTLLRRPVAAWLSAHPRRRGLAAELRDSGFTWMFLLRLSPLTPYNLFNYACAAAPVGWRSYLAATALGLLPQAWLFAWIGAGARNLNQALTASRDAVTAWGGLGWIAGVGLTLIALVWVGHRFRRRVRDSLPDRRD